MATFLARESHVCRLERRDYTADIGRIHCEGRDAKEKKKTKECLRNNEGQMKFIEDRRGRPAGSRAPRRNLLRRETTLRARSLFALNKKSRSATSTVPFGGYWICSGVDKHNFAGARQWTAV
ncbi:hypothetical protein EVAR_49029_1 [Eumeta japonica]|uniref:Uncharacterized protein n=1 Tax=Eumeta variegata TaxID=151549 RepID=A0A4C1XSR6_EUMVA|nr:hypothetical protein EVAR_49029_1 [Eumeta japonica]